MEILSPSILLKMTASVTNFSGNDFPNWLNLSTRLCEHCSSLFWEEPTLGGVLCGFAGEEKPFRSWALHPQDAHSPQYEPSSEVIHSTMISLLWYQTSSSHYRSQDLAVNHFLSTMCDLHFLNFFFTTMSMTLERNRPLKGSYRVPKGKETKQNIST